MGTEFVMPKLGLTMEEGMISEWLVADGAEVVVGAPVLRIETDKTETDIEASSAGRLHQSARAGETFACGEVVGWFLAPGETAPATAAPTSPVAAAPAAGTTHTVAATDVGATAVAPAMNGRVFVSPNARRVAAERGVPLASVRGTGPNGRIVSEDVEAWVPPATPPVTAAGTSPALATFAGRQLADLLGVDVAAVAPDTTGRVHQRRRCPPRAVAVGVRRKLCQRLLPARRCRQRCRSRRGSFR